MEINKEEHTEYDDITRMLNENKETISSINSAILKAATKDNLTKRLLQAEHGLYSSQKITKQISEAVNNIMAQTEWNYSLVRNLPQSSKNLVNAMSKMSLSMGLILKCSAQTAMIDNLTKAFANADYDKLSVIINESLREKVVPASDIAFLRAVKENSLIDNKLVFPSGMKTMMRSLNITTTADLLRNSTIQYDTHTSRFLSDGLSLNASEMNVVYAGKHVLNCREEELFSEEELINFISFLSLEQMMGLKHETGNKIYSWIKSLFEEKTYSMDFDEQKYYHCRSRKAENMPYTFEEMMKAPYGRSDAGRFNNVGRAHFYFSNTRKGAEVEVKKHMTDEEKKKQTLQTAILIPKRSINILDLSSTIARGKTFLKYIRYPLTDDSNKMPKEYLLPCFVADCCKNIGFDGIKYHGSNEYSSYVSWDDGYFGFGGMCVE